MKNIQSFVNAKEEAGLIKITECFMVNMSVMGKTIPLSIKNGKETKYFYIKPFSQKRGIILLEGKYAQGRITFFVAVSMKNGVPYAHILDNDEDKVVTTKNKIIQYVGSCVEIGVGDNTYTNNPDGHKEGHFVVSGDSLCLFVNDEITEAELCESATAEPEIVTLKRTMEKMQEAFYEREDQMADELDRLRSEIRRLKDANNHLTNGFRKIRKHVNLLRESTESFVKNYKDPWYLGKGNILKIKKEEIERKAIDLIYEIQTM